MDDQRNIQKTNIQNVHKDFDYYKKSELFKYLFECFKSPVITTGEFKKFFKINSPFMRSMCEKGTGPRVIPVTCNMVEGRILLFDLVEWIENMDLKDFFLGTKATETSGAKHGRKLKNKEVETVA